MFKTTECIELARRLENGELVVVSRRDLTRAGVAGDIGFVPSGVAPIIAALRAYAATLT